MTPTFGATAHKLDFAFRIKLREEERRELGNTLFMARGFDHRLLVYTPEAWERWLAECEKLPRHDPQADALYDLLAGSGEQCEVDAQGRVRIPEALLDWARLKDKSVACLVRSRDCWHIWEKENYEAFCERAEQLQRVMAEYFGGGRAREGGAEA
jgi:MraZ protein